MQLIKSFRQLLNTFKKTDDGELDLSIENIGKQGWDKDVTSCPIYKNMEEWVKWGKMKKIHEMMQALKDKKVPWDPQRPEPFMWFGNKGTACLIVQCYLGWAFPKQSAWLHAGVAMDERTKYVAGLNGNVKDADDTALPEKYKVRFLVAPEIMGTGVSVYGCCRHAFTEPQTSLRHFLQAQNRNHPTNQRSDRVESYVLRTEDGTMDRLYHGQLRTGQTVVSATTLLSGLTDD